MRPLSEVYADVICCETTETPFFSPLGHFLVVTTISVPQIDGQSPQSMGNQMKSESTDFQSRSPRKSLGDPGQCRTYVASRVMITSIASVLDIRTSILFSAEVVSCSVFIMRCQRTSMTAFSFPAAAVGDPP